MRISRPESPQSLNPAGLAFAEDLEKRQAEQQRNPQRRKDLHHFECKSLIHMVRLAGIEPTTPWFVAKYSIQLSYSRAA